jgi:hypothetical protein
MSHTLVVAQYVTEKFTKKILGEGEVETVLRRLDRLTQEEARVTVTYKNLRSVPQRPGRNRLSVYVYVPKKCLGTVSM